MQTIAQIQVKEITHPFLENVPVFGLEINNKKKFISMLSDLNLVCIIFEMGKNGYVPNFLPGVK